LVLVGGGHSHVEVLKHFGTRPLTAARITLVSRHVDTPYSGMLPGLVAGHYSFRDAHIDLRALAHFAGARTIFDEVTGLDLAERAVRFRDHPPLPYDVLSLNTGSTPSTSGLEGTGAPLRVKPIDSFLQRWEPLQQRLLESGTPTQIAVVGGGAAGVELLLAMQFRMRTLLHERGSTDAHLRYHLFTDTRTILPTYAAGVRRVFDRTLRERGVAVHTGQAVVRIENGRLWTADGREHEVDQALWATQAAAAPWLATSGLAVDPSGFVRVAETLESTSHAGVFAAGDVASVDRYPRPKSGVFAVRQGPPLARNLRRALLQQPLLPYRPQQHALSLISTGDRFAVASRGPIVVSGRWVWHWKDFIDRRFVRRYNELPGADLHVPSGARS